MRRLFALLAFTFAVLLVAIGASATPSTATAVPAAAPAAVANVAAPKALAPRSVNLLDIPATHSNSGSCVTPNVSPPALPNYQLLDLSVNNPFGPIYVFNGAKILVYTYAYGFAIGWVNYDVGTYHSPFHWPATLYRPDVWTYSPRYLGGPNILIEIAANQVSNIGTCTI